MKLWTRIALACLLLVSAPLAFAWSMGLYDEVESRRIRGELSAVGAALLERAARDPAFLDDAVSLDVFARVHEVLVRVMARDGLVTATTEAELAEGRISRRWWFRRVADFFFGPGGAPDLAAFEQAQGPLSGRPEVKEARAGGLPVDGMARPDRSSMLVFSRALPVGEGRIVHLTQVSRRSVRALYDVRFQLLKLTLALLGGAAVMAVWLGWSVVGPLRRLQQGVRAWRAGERQARLALPRRDEIGDLSRDFDALAVALEERVERTARVTADFAHDLKNPLATVRASAELLEEGAPLDSERRARLAHRIAEASEHIARSVDGMLVLARLEEELGEEGRRVVDLVASSREVVAGMREAIEAAGLVVEVVAGEEALEVVGVEPRLRQALQNLLDNALVFARERVEVRLERREGRVDWVVSDDGPGVSEGNRDKIFGRFFTARPRGAASGTGLGLSIVASIAEAHGAQLSLDPATEGASGATFRLTFMAG
ncbi:MAG: HAMP domain-containing protein [Myxococcales bacterium]|nr:HAMP domain-containing protein [Myxococcales bacterium]